jgi:hypothetical protein
VDRAGIFVIDPETEVPDDPPVMAFVPVARSPRYKYTKFIFSSKWHTLKKADAIQNFKMVSCTLRNLKSVLK